MPAARSSLEAALASGIEVDPATGCHNWTKNLHVCGYGRVTYRGRSHWTHRAAFEISNGPVPEGLELDHLCRNRACCNPEHLEPVTHKVNTLRGVSPFAENARKTHCNRGHRLEGDNVRLVERRGTVERHCRTCNRLAVRAYAARKRQRAILETLT